jgi:hypothetical protein
MKSVASSRDIPYKLLDKSVTWIACFNMWRALSSAFTLILWDHKIVDNELQDL